VSHGMQHDSDYERDCDVNGKDHDEEKAAEARKVAEDLEVEPGADPKLSSHLRWTWRRRC
jgi:hypothetical protein